ncbi:hypothetical protein [Kushneria sp. TE3]|uniref:hypothetical protein n=1 Tax=Kushneria sp. TE3 TaxID=3449832 RepID=UPI003F6885E2
MKHNLMAGSVLLATMLLGGCAMWGDRVPGAAEEGCITRGIPTMVDDECLLPTWVAFGRTAQTGTQQWRDEVLQYMDDDTPRSGLARAVVFSQEDAEHWPTGLALFKRYTPQAPESIQPLLEQWQRDLERRTELQSGLQSRLDAQHNRSHQGNSRQRQQIQSLQQQNAELKKKLDALTAIEESMNARQTP